MHLEESFQALVQKVLFPFFLEKEQVNELMITATQKGGGEEEEVAPRHLGLLPLARFPGVGGLGLARGGQSQVAGTGGPYRARAGDMRHIETSRLLWS